MMTPTKRAPNSVIVPTIALEQATLALGALPEKPKESWSLREAVEHMQGMITAALDKGYSYEEIAVMLSDKGVEIRASSLKRYLATAKKGEGTATKPQRRPRRTQAEMATVGQLDAQEDAVDTLKSSLAQAASTGNLSTSKTTASDTKDVFDIATATPEVTLEEAAPPPKRRGRSSTKEPAKTAATTKPGSTRTSSIPSTRRRKGRSL